MTQPEVLIKGLEDPVFQDNSVKFAKEQEFGENGSAKVCHGSGGIVLLRAK